MSATPAPCHAVRALVSGRVQGVRFRESTREEARRLGVSGWVRNLDTGQVELHAEGSRAAVDALIAWARRGPARAAVTGLETEVARPGGFEDFEVRHG